MAIVVFRIPSIKAFTRFCTVQTTKQKTKKNLNTATFPAQPFLLLCPEEPQTTYRPPSWDHFSCYRREEINDSEVEGATFKISTKSDRNPGPQRCCLSAGSKNASESSQFMQQKSSEVCNRETDVWVCEGMGAAEQGNLGFFRHILSLAQFPQILMDNLSGWGIMISIVMAIVIVIDSSCYRLCKGFTYLASSGRPE